MPVAQAVDSCRLEQVIAGAVVELGIGPHAVGVVLGAELLHAAGNLDGTSIQQLHPRVVLKGGERPQGVGHLLRGVLGQGVNSPVDCGIQDRPPWVITQLSIRPQAVGNCLQANRCQQAGCAYACTGCQSASRMVLAQTFERATRD